MRTKYQQKLQTPGASIQQMGIQILESERTGALIAINKFTQSITFSDIPSQKSADNRKKFALTAHDLGRSTSILSAVGGEDSGKLTRKNQIPSRYKAFIRKVRLSRGRCNAFTQTNRNKQKLKASWQTALASDDNEPCIHSRSEPIKPQTLSAFEFLYTCVTLD
jgi:hypothetical protein